jgi:hypothetical protein
VLEASNYKEVKFSTAEWPIDGDGNWQESTNQTNRWFQSCNLLRILRHLYLIMVSGYPIDSTEMFSVPRLCWGRQFLLKETLD